MTDIDDYDPFDDYDDLPREPYCFGCCDTGFAEVPLLRWLDLRPPLTRDRADRSRCASCNPSQRQRRRMALRQRRSAQKWQRDLAAGRVTLDPPGSDPF